MKRTGNGADSADRWRSMMKGDPDAAKRVLAIAVAAASQAMELTLRSRACGYAAGERQGLGLLALLGDIIDDAKAEIARADGVELSSSIGGRA